MPDGFGWGLMFAGLLTVVSAPAVWSTPAWQWGMMAAGFVMVIVSGSI